MGGKKDYWGGEGIKRGNLQFGVNKKGKEWGELP